MMATDENSPLTILSILCRGYFVNWPRRTACVRFVAA